VLLDTGIDRLRNELDLETKMQRLTIMIWLLGAVSALEGSAGLAQESGEKSEILVAQRKAECPNARFYSIQDAVNAARRGDTIRVCQGEYAEQVVVGKSVKLVGDKGAVLVPQHMVKNASSLSTGEPLAVGILVSGAEGVDVTGFTVDTRNNGLAGCLPKLIGILYQNASGHVASNSVRHVRLGSSGSACRSGNAIEVQSGNAGRSKVDIHDNSVDDYQINAITANGEGTYVGIEENEITTTGPAERVSWNGIQVAFGASGVIERNTLVADLPPHAMPSRCASNTTGILVFESKGVHVLANSVQSLQTGILVAGNRTKISGNKVSNCSPVHGIVVLGDENEVTRNELPNGGEAAMFVQGEKNLIQINQASGGSREIIEVAYFWDNLISDDAFIVEPAPMITPKPIPSR
jgi:hypothetical protein